MARFRTLALALAATAALALPALAASSEETFLVVRVSAARVVVHARPGGAAVGALGKRTEFGSPQTLSVVERRGRWVGVVTAAVRNGRIGWVDGSRARLDYRRVRVNLDADLSKRTLRVKLGATTVRVIHVDIGGPSAPTPIGRYAITDKLPGARFSPVYGCCILALSGHQGSRRLAIHGTPPGSVAARALSQGCLHARAADLRYLMRVVPLGTPVFVHP